MQISELNKEKRVIIVKSILWNTIETLFYKVHKVELKGILKSIRILNHTIIITTNKPLINNQLILLDIDIRKETQNSLMNFDFDLKKYQIHYK